MGVNCQMHLFSLLLMLIAVSATTLLHTAVPYSGNSESSGMSSVESVVDHGLNVHTIITFIIFHITVCRSSQPEPTLISQLIAQAINPSPGLQPLPLRIGIAGKPMLFPARLPP